MISEQEVQEFVNKLIQEQQFFTGKIKDIHDSKERRQLLKQIEQFNKLITLLYDLKV